jgi:hypothetical protein
VVDLPTVIEVEALGGDLHRVQVPFWARVTEQS